MNRKEIIGGVFDIGVGVPDAEEALLFWEACGYRAGPEGSLGSVKAKSLYGVDSDLRSIRLLHQDATAGLVRLMVWDKPSGVGLNKAPLKTHGNRWSVHKTDDLLNAYIHGEVYRRQGGDISLFGPEFNLDLGVNMEDKKPFREVLSSNGDVLLFTPHAQYILMTRINYDVSKYGTINVDCPLRGSEGCHMAIVVQGDDISIFDFYEDVIGFKRYHQVDIEYKPDYMPSKMFDLTPDESFSEVDFDDPEAGDAPSEHLPGRLRCFLCRAPFPLDDRLALSQPGNLGYSLFTVRVGDLNYMHRKVASSAAKTTTEIMTDEFDNPAFSFVAPDGFTWTVIQYQEEGQI